MLRGSLAQRHDSIARLLAAMQRMGRNPPPVMITRREDALMMVRSAMMLATAFPELRDQAMALAGRLNDLARVMADIRTEGDKLKAETTRLNDSRTRLAQLMESKRQSLAERQVELDRVRREAVEIARNVTDLNELITRLDKAVAAHTGQDTHPAADAGAGTAASARLEVAALPEANLVVPSASLLADPNTLTGKKAGGVPAAIELAPQGTKIASLNPGRIKPAVPFNRAKGLVLLPAQGRRVLTFGDKTQYGGQSKGLVLETRHGGQVTSPCDGWIVYAGEFRTYGQLLIINAGGGYHILLAGLSQIDVQLGQFVLTGEPVGVMSAAAKAQKSNTQDNAPVLYIEFRKDSSRLIPTPGGRMPRKRCKDDAQIRLCILDFRDAGGLAGATTVLNVTRTYSATSTNSEIYKQLDLFGDVLERVRSDYVEKPDDSMLIDTAINGMLAALDPHSAYLNPKNFRDMQVQTRGEFGGLGIEVTMENGVVKVVSPIDDTPAAKAGLQANDLITHLDGEQIVGLTLEQAVEKMRGPVNTPITLTIVRKGKDDPFDVKIVRDVIRINAIKARAEGDIIYVKVSTFNEQTHANLVKAVDGLKKSIGKNLKGYVIDLRNNPGGLLDQAIAVSDDFLEKGAIVLTKGRGLEETQRANARPGDITEGKQVMVLINGGSASASEIVAGALQDHKRATVIGTRSFGKGSVQTIIPLGAERRHPTDHGALLHAVGPLDPGQGHRSRHRRRAGAAARASKSAAERHAGEAEPARPPQERQRQGQEGRVGLVQLRAEGGREGHAAAVRA